jgi:hypothetical protein
MTEKEAQEKLMDYLFDEMSESEKKEFEAILVMNPGLQKELRELQSTHQLLKSEPGEIPHKNLLVIPPDDKTGGQLHAEPKGKSKIFYLKMGAAIAAAVLLAALALSFVNLQIEQTDRGLMLSFGDQPAAATQPAEPQISEAEVYELISELQEENTRLLANVLEQTRIEHQQQMTDIIETLTAYYDQRRREDLILIGEGLAQFEEETYYRFLQTEEALEDLIFALSYQQSVE